MKHHTTFKQTLQQSEKTTGCEENINYQKDYKENIRNREKSKNY